VSICKFEFVTVDSKLKAFRYVLWIIFGIDPIGNDGDKANVKLYGL
jgi:hypothetical protein